MPLRLREHAMVTSPTGKGVIVMGGETESGEDSIEIFELTQSMEWTRLEQTLQIEHYGGLLAIPIPDELVYDKIKPISDLSPLSTSLYFLMGGILLALLMLYFTQ